MVFLQMFNTFSKINLAFLLCKVEPFCQLFFSDFLTHGALCEVNIDAKTMDQVRNGNSEKDVNR